MWRSKHASECTHTKSFVRNVLLTLDTFDTLVGRWGALSREKKKQLLSPFTIAPSVNFYIKIASSFVFLHFFPPLFFISAFACHGLQCIDGVCMTTNKTAMIPSFSSHPDTQLTVQGMHATDRKSRWNQCCADHMQAWKWNGDIASFGVIRSAFCHGTQGK